MVDISWYLCLGVNKSLHGNSINLGQHVLILVQYTEFLHQSGLHLPHGFPELLGMWEGQDAMRCVCVGRELTGDWLAQA